MTSKAQARPFISQRSLSVLAALALISALALLPQHAHAAVGAGGGLPWEDWFTNPRASVTGPVAFAFSIIGLVVAGGVLIFGGELNAFFRTFMFLVLVMAILVAAQNIMANFFGRGAEIAALPVLTLLG
jgi:type IV secretion system protein VirB2